VFVLIGVWHMPTWNAVIYGAYFGIVMSVSMLLEPVYKLVNKRLGIPKKGFISFFRMMRTWLMILPAQYFAFSTDTALSLRLIKGTFTGWSFKGFTELATGIMSGLEWAIAGAALVILLIVDIICEVSKKDICERLAKGCFLIRWLLLIILILIILVFGVYGEGFDGAAFMYTQF